MNETYRIAVARSFGAPDVINLESHPIPALPSGAVRVAVRIGGLNPVDARRRSGTFGGRPPLVFGTEFAGVVIESKSSQFPEGSEVIGWGTQGADAELVVADPERLALKPQTMPWPLAGGLNGVGQTALTALNTLNLPAGKTIVVHGASGGVGTALTQLAIRRGLRVIGTASAANQDYVASLGALPVIYGSGLADRIGEAAAEQPVAASIDLAGTAEAGDFAQAVLRGGGQAITLVPETMASHSLQLVSVRHSTAQLAELLDAIEAQELTLPVSTVPFEEIREAHARLDSKHAQGKLVLDLSSNPHLPASAR